MLTKIDHWLWFTVFADFWMVCFFSIKITVRVVTQKQFVSSIAHFNTFFFWGKFSEILISQFQKLLHWCVTFFVHTVVPVQGRSHEQKFRITIPRRTFGVTKTTLVSTKEFWARKQETTTQLCETRCCTSSDVQLEVGGRRNANKRFPIIFPTQLSPLYRQSHKCSETRAVVKLSC